MSGEYSTNLTDRYSDAYKIARVYTGLGSTVKILGFIIAIITGFVIIMVFVKASEARDAIVVAVPLGVISGGAIALIFYVIGVLVSGAGQHLKASLDTAVNSSPHLTDGEKAEIMSLRFYRSSTAQIATSSYGFCNECGKELTLIEKQNSEESLCKEHSAIPIPSMPGV